MPVAPQPSTIKTAGGDYPTLTLWKADIPATLTGLGEFRAINYINGLTEALGVPFTGFTTTATDKIVLDGSGLQHNGIAHSGAYVTNGAGSIFDTIRVGTNVNHFEVFNFEIEGVNGKAALQWQSGVSGANLYRCTRSIIHSDGNTVGTAGSGTNYEYENDLVYSDSTGIRFFDTRGCTSIKITYVGFASVGGVDFPVLVDGAATVKNCWAIGATNQCFINSGGSSAGNNNASSDATATALYTASVANIVPANVFTQVTSPPNYTLKAGANVLVDAGITIGGIGVDIIGTTRPQGSAPDIGPFERIAAAAAGPFAYPDFQNPRAAMRADQSTMFLGSSETLLLLSGNDALPFRNRDFPNPRAAMQPVQTQRQGFPAPYIPTITQAPFSKTDWPVPRGAARRDDGTQPLGSPETLILLSGQDALPARNRDFPNPRSAPQPVQTPRLGTAAMTLTPGLDALPFRKLDWPNPRGFIPPIQTQPLGLTTPYLAALVAPPFAQTDWPNPRGSRWPDLTQPLGTPDNLLLLAGKDALPFRLTDFPNPRGYGPPIQTQPQGVWRFLTAAAPAPVQPIDWPNPRPAAQPVQTQPQGAWAYITAALAPVFAQMWPNPRPAPAPAQPQAQGVGLILIGPAGIPVRPIDWPNPRAAFRPDFTQPQGGVIKPVGPKPFAQTDWPNPRCPMQPIYTQPLGTAMSGLNPPIPTRCHTVSGDPRVRTVFGEDRIRIVVGGCC